MGIGYLNSFMTKHMDICKPFKLHDTTVIIDGSYLFFSLHVNEQLDLRYGGEYERFYDCVRKYILRFLECNIKPIIIFNGGHEKSVGKLHSCIKRNEYSLECVQDIARWGKSKYPVFPLLAYEVFYSVLFYLDIPLVNCDYDADGQVAALGNYYDCPVISSDSDFYVFHAHKGFIHIDSIDKEIKLDTGSDGKEYKFLNCKIYYIDDFVQSFSGLEKDILPLFGALFRSEFVDRKTFHNFFASIQAPGYTEDRHWNMKETLRWLRTKTLNEAVNEVTSYVEENDQEYIKSVIDISVCGYKMKPCSLTFSFEQINNDSRNDLLSNSMITTPCGNPLPRDFVLKFRQGHLPSFFVDIIGLHTVFLEPQVEDEEYFSSHTCSSYIRQILYGILVKHDINETECRNRACLHFIEEYERRDDGIKKDQVLPIFSVEGLGTLPKINEVHSISKEQCIAIIAKVLGVNSDFFLHIPEEWQLFIGSTNYWLRIPGYRSDNFISAVILNVIYFGLIKCKNPFLDQKCCPEKMAKSDKCTCSSIACLATNISESDLYSAGEKLKEYYINPMSKLPGHSMNFVRGSALDTVRSFCQLQSCVLQITYLNQLLNECLKNPALQKCFSGTMLCSLTKAIESSPFPYQFIINILGKDLYLLFTQLKSKVCENAHYFTVFKRNRRYPRRNNLK